MEVLAMPFQPVRYVVTNTEKIILVTHDYYYALKLVKDINSLEQPSKFYVKIQK
jgi:hypothetical protein